MQPSNPLGRLRGQIRKEQRLGDPRYLDIILNAMEREAKLRGTDAAIWYANRLLGGATPRSPRRRRR